MTRTQLTGSTVKIDLRLPDDLLKAVDALAAEQKFSRNLLLVRLLDSAMRAMKAMEEER